MDEFNNEGLGYMFMVLIGFSLLILVIVNYYDDLYKFKKCYDNDFSLSYC